MSEPWQVLADCPHCLVEAAIVEWMDPSHEPSLRGVPLERRCRCCGMIQRSDPSGELSTTAEPMDLAAPGAARQPVTTTFDVIAFLFPGSGTGSVGSLGLEVEPPRLIDGAEPPPAPPRAPRASMDPRTPARVLVSVMVADGTLRAAERTFVARFLEREGAPPLGPEDLRVWRPSELGPPPPSELRDRLLEACVHLMHLDREREGSEWRVIRSFAGAWGVPEERLRSWDQSYDRRYSSAMARLGLLVHRLLGR